MSDNFELALLLLALFTTCTGDQWLMEGDLISDSDALARNLLVESTNSTTSVSSSMELSLSAPPGFEINCVMAAALHMEGNVSLAKGGLGTDRVSLLYRSLHGRPDLFFVMVESHADGALRLRDGLAEVPRLAIAYQQLNHWNLLGGVEVDNVTQQDPPLP